MNYYNENDPKAVAWLMELISQKAIPDGVVDSRPIQDVSSNDLTDYIQCHFFAGIGGWAYALQLAGWPEDREVWTGSCPCQPFSAAGKQQGFNDDRHLWPYFFQLIEQRRPATIFGEQVASKAGRTWLDLVSTDLEGAGYAVGSADLAAASIGAPHIRQRLYWMADADRSRRGPGRAGQARDGYDATREQLTRLRDAGGVRGISGYRADQRTPWAASLVDWLLCTDGKHRPVESGTFPLAYGVPARVGRLRGYGNAIVPQVAQAFIEAYMDVMGGVK